jgi:hypothetical protein
MTDQRWFKLWIGYTLPPSDDPSDPTGGLVMHYMPLWKFPPIFNDLIERCPHVDIVADITTLPNMPEIPVTWKAVPK